MSHGHYHKRRIVGPFVQVGGREEVAPERRSTNGDQGWKENGFTNGE